MTILAHTVSKNGKKETILCKSANGTLRLERLKVGVKGVRIATDSDGTYSNRTTWAEFYKVTANQVPSGLTPAESDRRLWKAYRAN